MDPDKRLHLRLMEHAPQATLVREGEGLVGGSWTAWALGCSPVEAALAKLAGELSGWGSSVDRVRSKVGPTSPILGRYPCGMVRMTAKSVRL